MIHGGSHAGVGYAQMPLPSTARLLSSTLSRSASPKASIHASTGGGGDETDRYRARASTGSLLNVRPETPWPGVDSRDFIFSSLHTHSQDAIGTTHLALSRQRPQQLARSDAVGRA